MEIRVRLFGRVREAVGAAELAMQVDPHTRVGALRAQLARELPVFAEPSGRLRAAVNHEFVDENALLREGDEVAFLPPVAGGSGRFTLSEQPLEVDEVRGRVTGDERGGCVTFVGTVRSRTSDGQSVLHLEYEAYPEMTERELERIGEEVHSRWAGTQLAIAHRVGRLQVGEAAVVVVAAAPHRSDAFAACQFAIDRLKEVVPIWKREVTTEGTTWVEPHAGHASRFRAVPTAVITVSDTRTPESDRGGKIVRELLEQEGHPVVEHTIVPDDVKAIRDVVRTALERSDVHAIVLTGGTGIAPRDVTPEALHLLLDHELPGFGEIFRMLSFEEIGSRAIASRALAGIAAGRLVVALPGSPAAVRLGMERLVLRELPHLVAEARKEHVHAS